jgi:1,2-diacylglycerol 3-alpha-glucosyltransferase
VHAPRVRARNTRTTAAQTMKIALLCSGLGHVHRGHEVFAQDIFRLLHKDLDITIFKGGGVENSREIVINTIPRYSNLLDHITPLASEKWKQSAIEMERVRIETTSFAWGALPHLLSGEFDIIHCLEEEVCNAIWSLRHLFKKTPTIVWSNGGALKAAEIPDCDYVQEYTKYNHSRSIQRKAFVIPHAVDLDVFQNRPEDRAAFRRAHNIPTDAFVVITVGTICYWHKRTHHIISEVAKVPNAWLIAAGQRNQDSAAIQSMAEAVMPGRTIFKTMPHHELPQAYAAADVFTLGSLFETFGIAYIEAMAMGLPVISTHHVNQIDIIKDGIFIDMRKEGALTHALNTTTPAEWQRLSALSRSNAERFYSIDQTKQAYIRQYQDMLAHPAQLPAFNLRHRLAGGIRGTWRHLKRR